MAAAAAAAAAPPFFSGFDMALLLGVLAAILASNPLHLSSLFVSGNPDYNISLSVDANPSRLREVSF